eukprot:augustus_masked-scaffold_12-processed-gene-12.83-mRNA-1 protein AED:0.11 eAED:1.00 QI:0/-1/0/1/-1/1/1/0/211
MEEIYEDDLTTQIKELEGNLLQLKDSIGSDSNTLIESNISQVESSVKSVNSSFKQFENEIKVSSRKDEFKNKLEAYRKEIRSHSDQFKSLKSSFKRDALFSGEFNASDDETRRLMEVNERIQKSNETLLRSQGLMNDLLESGADITDKLKSNRETLESAHDRLRTTNNLTGQADTILRRMSNRNQRQKLAIKAAFGVIGFLMIYLVFSSIF